jgi:hypothetical protein
MMMVAQELASSGMAVSFSYDFFSFLMDDDDVLPTAF